MKNYQEEEVDAHCKIENDKIILTISSETGTVQITRQIIDDKLHVDQILLEKNISAKRIFHRTE